MTDTNPSSAPVGGDANQIGADLARLREDLGKLSMSVAELVKAQASQASTAMRGAVGGAREKLSTGTADAKQKLAGTAADVQGRITDKAVDAQDRFMAATADLETAIERNPLVAVLIALFVGLLLGTMTRGQK